MARAARRRPGDPPIWEDSDARDEFLAIAETLRSTIGDYWEEMPPEVLTVLRATLERARTAGDAWGAQAERRSTRRGEEDEKRRQREAASAQPPAED